jgi:hypothetical protein
VLGRDDHAEVGVRRLAVADPQLARAEERPTAAKSEKSALGDEAFEVAAQPLSRVAR